MTHSFLDFLNVSGSGSLHCASADWQKWDHACLGLVQMMSTNDHSYWNNLSGNTGGCQRQLRPKWALLQLAQPLFPSRGSMFPSWPSTTHSIEHGPGLSHRRQHDMLQHAIAICPQSARTLIDACTMFWGGMQAPLGTRWMQAPMRAWCRR